MPKRTFEADPQAIADAYNTALIESVHRRAADSEGVLGPCLASYERRLERRDEHPLRNITRHLVDTFPETSESIRRRMKEKWRAKGGSDDEIQRSIVNSFRRSAGTNYQGLVSYALARFLRDSRSHWFVQHPVPKLFRTELAIRFTGGLEEPVIEDIEEAIEEVESVGVVVKPDIDILIRHADWTAQATPEPLLLLSVKTSLADRAGMAARWKTYFDLVTRPCPHIGQRGCAYKRLGIELAGDPNVDVTHGIVTANIYKIYSDSYYAEFGELRKEQARSNTFMFDLRYSTRNDNEKVMTPEWAPLSDVTEWLEGKSNFYELPT